MATVAASGKLAEKLFGAVTEEAGKLFGADAAMLLRFEAALRGTMQIASRPATVPSWGITVPASTRPDEGDSG